MLKLSLQCHKHPRYNPVKQGEQAIKGGCELCFALFQLSLQMRRVTRLRTSQLWNGFGQFSLPLILTLSRKSQRLLVENNTRPVESDPNGTFPFVP